MKKKDIGFIIGILLLSVGVFFGTRIVLKSVNGHDSHGHGHQEERVEIKFKNLSDSAQKIKGIYDDFEHHKGEEVSFKLKEEEILENEGEYYVNIMCELENGDETFMQMPLKFFEGFDIKDIEGKEEVEIKGKVDKIVKSCGEGDHKHEHEMPLIVVTELK